MNKKTNANQTEILFVFCNSSRHHPVQHRVDEECPICSFCDQMIRLANGRDADRGDRMPYKGVAG